MPNKRIDIPLDGVGEQAPRRSFTPHKGGIDVPLDGVGEGAGAGAAPQAGADHRPSSIDVPLEGPKRAGAGFNLGAKSINDAELEIVNRHHEDMKARHRAALSRAKGGD